MRETFSIGWLVLGAIACTHAQFAEECLPPSEPPLRVCMDTRYFPLLGSDIEEKVVHYFENPVPNLPAISFNSHAVARNANRGTAVAIGNAIANSNNRGGIGKNRDINIVEGNVGPGAGLAFGGGYAFGNDGGDQYVGPGHMGYHVGKRKSRAVNRSLINDKVVAHRADIERKRQRTVDQRKTDVADQRKYLLRLPKTGHRGKGSSYYNQMNYNYGYNYGYKYRPWHHYTGGYGASMARQPEIPQNESVQTVMRALLEIIEELKQSRSGEDATNDQKSGGNDVEVEEEKVEEQQVEETKTEAKGGNEKNGKKEKKGKKEKSEANKNAVKAKDEEEAEKELADNAPEEEEEDEGSQVTEKKKKKQRDLDIKEEEEVVVKKDAKEKENNKMKESIGPGSSLSIRNGLSVSNSGGSQKIGLNRNEGLSNNIIYEIFEPDVGTLKVNGNYLIKQARAEENKANSPKLKAKNKVGVKANRLKQSRVNTRNGTMRTIRPAAPTARNGVKSNGNLLTALKTNKNNARSMRANGLTARNVGRMGMRSGEKQHSLHFSPPTGPSTVNRNTYNIEYKATPDEEYMIAPLLRMEGRRGNRLLELPKAGQVVNYY